jgi:hypothetical protein
MIDQNYFLDYEPANQKIKELIELNTSFLAGKMGAVEMGLMKSFFYNNQFTESDKWPASNNAGISPPSDYIMDYFVKVYTESLKEVDLLAIWDRNNSQEIEISKKLSPNSKFINGLVALEPYYHENPWSEALRGKKVLVVHPFEDSIKEQYLKRNLLFKDSRILPEFELITIKAYQTHGGGDTTLSWDKCYEDMAEKIEGQKFDVALVGAGAYGLPLCRVAKLMGKSVVHVGGALQILFGIKGKRWENNLRQLSPDEEQLDHRILAHKIGINVFYNENWKRPNDTERPISFSNVEGACYW